MPELEQSVLTSSPVYMNGFQCKITGQTGNTPIGKPGLGRRYVLNIPTSPVADVDCRQAAARTQPTVGLMLHQATALLDPSSHSTGTKQSATT